MGRKTNPTILRVSSVVRSWDGKWFSDRRSTYHHRLREDLLIRRYFARKLRAASVARIEIERSTAAARARQELVLTIHTSRPALLIGRGGSGIELIQRDLARLLGGRLTINVQEVRNPDTDAVAIATQVVEQLERRLPFRRVLKQAVSRARQAGALGVRVAVAGRLNGAEIARREWLAEGNVPLQSFRADVSYAVRSAFTPYGTVGVKVWVNRGDLLPEEEVPGEERKARPTVRKGGSLADKARVSAGAAGQKSA